MNRHKEIKLVAVFGIIGNILLLTAKLTSGFLTKSQAMIADGLNSAGDVFASVMPLVGNKISSKPRDKDHPYGHGKAEYIFSMIFSFSLFCVGVNIFKSAYDALLIKQSFLFSPILIIVALGTMLLKACLYIHARLVGRKHNSLLSLANAADHRNDILISFMTLISVITGYYGIYIVDGIVGLLISLWIVFTSFKIFSSAYDVLMDKTLDEKLKAEMIKAVTNIEGIDHIDAIHSKPVGLDFLLMVKVSVDAELTIYEGHNIADMVKERLMGFPNINDVIVHLNPAQYHPKTIHDEFIEE